MNTQNIKSLIHGLVITSMCCISLYYIFWGKRGYSTYQKLSEEISQEQGKVSQLEQEIQTLKNKITAWNSNDFEREKLVRQDLHMGTTNEILYMLPNIT